MIVLTGPTGTVGAALLAQLTDEGAPVRALVRSQERADSLRGYDVDIALGSFEEPESLDHALRRAEAVFVLAPAGERMAEQEAAVLRSVRAAATEPRVVVLAAAGVDDGGTAGGPLLDQHRRVVAQLERDGIPATVLAPTSFQQNLLGQAAQVAERGILALPGGDAHVAHVDARDVAAVAAHVLTTPGHEGRTYTLTGPEAMGYAEVATALSQALGREVRYVDVPPEQARQAMLASGMDPWLAEAILALNEGYRAGLAATVTDEVQRATGRPARSVAQFLAEHRSAFGG